jgi:hypothetical protein
MSAADVADSLSHWSYVPTLIRLALAFGCGAFVGLDRTADYLGDGPFDRRPRVC